MVPLKYQVLIWEALGEQTWWVQYEVPSGSTHRFEPYGERDECSQREVWYRVPCKRRSDPQGRLQSKQAAAAPCHTRQKALKVVFGGRCLAALVFVILFMLRCHAVRSSAPLSLYSVAPPFRSLPPNRRLRCLRYRATVVLYHHVCVHL
jgi:hypothetical protein